jgi:hypothetical protein
MPKVSREFSFGWATVKPPGEAVSYDTDLRFFRRDLETGREISNELIHGADYALREQTQTV